MTKWPAEACFDCVGTARDETTTVEALRNSENLVVGFGTENANVRENQLLNCYGKTPVCVEIYDQLEQNTETRERECRKHLFRILSRGDRFGRKQHVDV